MPAKSHAVVEGDLARIQLAHSSMAKGARRIGLITGLALADHERWTATLKRASDTLSLKRL